MSEHTNLPTLADNLANKIGPVDTTWEDLRDLVDGMTGSELDCQPLDILTDMVMKRVCVISTAKAEAQSGETFRRVHTDDKGFIWEDWSGPFGCFTCRAPGQKETRSEISAKAHAKRRAPRECRS